MNLSVTILIITFIVIYFFLYLRIITITNIKEYIFVTSLYAGKSKHSKEKYKHWINSFSNVLKENLFIFCNKEGYKILNPNLRKFVNVINDVFDLERIRDYKYRYKEMWKIDPEKDIHNYRLYGIWNGKISMLKYITEYVNSKIYIWILVQIEKIKFAIHSHLLKESNFYKILQLVDLCFFFQLKNFNKIDNKNISLLNNVYLEGTSFGGSKYGVSKYYDDYFSLHDKFLNLNEFVGKDQTLFNTIAYYNLSKVVLLKYKSNSCNNNIWFRFYDFYAGKACANVDIS